MPIDSLVLHNWKSYEGTHRVPLRDAGAFASIIGANGSGKSNVMESISFVMGLSSRQLRGASLRELIHRRDDEEALPRDRRAYVEVVYADEATGAETAFRRSITPAGAASYSLDGRAVKWAAYNARLKEIGVLVRARNFLVFQGDVEAIAQKTPRQLTELFEQISGSGELREEYERLAEEKDRAGESFARAFERKKAVAKEERQVREQKEEAERFQALLAQQKAVKLEYFLWQLFHVERDLDAHVGELASERGSLEERRGALAAAEEELQGRLAGVAKQGREAARREKALTKRRRALDARRPAVIKARQEMGHREGALKQHAKVVRKMRKDAKEHARRLAGLEKDAEEVRGRQAEFERAVESGEDDGLRLAASELREYHGIKEAAGARTAAARHELDEALRDRRQREEAAAALDAQVETLRGQRDALVQHTESLGSRRDKMRQHVEDTEKRLAGEAARLDEMTRRASANAARRDELTRSLGSLQQRLTELKADQRQNERDSRMLECLETLKRLFPGVRGRVLDLCKPVSGKYNAAVQVAMGHRNLEAVVVDDEKTAVECIQYMKEQRIGTATFIPLATIRTKPIDESLRQLGGSLRLVIDVLQFDATCTRAIMYACGSALVCDTLDEARQYAFGHGRSRPGGRQKVVTLDGTVIAKGGNMTGGTLGRGGGGGGGGKAGGGGGDRWDEQANQVEFQAASAARDRMVKELSELDQTRRLHDEEQVVRTQIKGLENRLKYTKMDLKVTAEKLAKAQEKMASIEAEMAEKEPEAKRLRESLASEEDAAHALREKISAEEDALFAEFSAKVGVANIREYEESRVAAAEERLSERLRLKEELSRLESQLEYERSRNLDAPLAEAEERVASGEEELEKLRQREAELVEALKKDQGVIDEETAAAEALRAEMDSVQADLKGLKQRAAAARKAISHADRRITTLESKVEQLRSVRHEVFRRCRLEQVRLPVKKDKKKKKGEGAAPSPAKKKRKQRRQAKRKGGRGKRRRRADGSSGEEEEDDEEEDDEGMGEEEEEGDEDDEEEEEEVVDDDNDGGDGVDDNVRVSFSGLKRHRKIESLEEYERIKAQYQDEMSAIAQQCEHLAPNLKAVEHFADVQDRAKAAARELGEAKGDSQAAVGAFEKVRRERHDAFMDAFEKVAGCIDEIYKDLTKSSKFPMGGTAYLVVEDTKRPFLEGVKYTAMPPMKRFRDMEQLSGGEKTVAALALLFAIHQYHPAPFFVLDEVDAALDASNVNKVSNFIREKARRDGLQCIVISLKESFYSKADSLVGIYKDQERQSSGTLTVSLDKYRRAGSRAARKRDDDDDDDEDDGNAADNSSVVDAAMGDLPPIDA